MKKVFFTLGTLVLGTTLLCAQEKVDSMKHVQLEEITVSAIRVSSSSSVAHTNVNEQVIKSDNAAKNLPALLQLLPSVVAYTEGGTAVGNMSFRIRGTDANRINMTLNGMPLNNPETQEVYWANIPDLSNSLKSMQVQRGVGSSTAGTASFGGSISMQTVGARAKPYADVSTSWGQYNTFEGSVASGSGVMKSGLSVDARYSYIGSDGYIRNGKVDHKNLYASLSHFTDRQMLRLAYINGIQHTGITWEGVSPEMKAVDRRYNPAGEYVDDEGRTQYYGNETDNYYSHIVQAIYSRILNKKMNVNANFGYNSGYGYYENYKTSREFKDFGLPNQTVGAEVYDRSDVIRRKLMSNDLYSGGGNINYRNSDIDVTIGANYTYFAGDHYGKLLWVKRNENISPNYEWYRNESEKKDFNNFAKVSYTLSPKIVLTGELQGRFVNYKLWGVDDDLARLDGDKSYYFFNPKMGGTYAMDGRNEIYASFAISNREPLRADLKESLKGELPKPIDSERLLDYELGYRHKGTAFAWGANFYYMTYKNQLVQTGRLSDTGYKYQENVPNSFRMGVELEAMYTPTYWLTVGGNLTLSQSKIKDYTAYYDYYEYNEAKEKWETNSQVSEFHKKTNISYSPNVVGSAVVKVKPLEKEDFSFTFANKYVGSMFYDNTSNKENRLSDYFTTDFRVSYGKAIGFAKKLEMQLMVNNIFNKKYDANAWVDTSVYANGTRAVYKGLFPQAATNVMGRVTISF